MGAFALPVLAFPLFLDPFIQALLRCPSLEAPPPRPPFLFARFLCHFLPSLGPTGAQFLLTNSLPENFCFSSCSLLSGSRRPAAVLIKNKQQPQKKPTKKTKTPPPPQKPPPISGSYRFLSNFPPFWLFSAGPQLHDHVRAFFPFGFFFLWEFLPEVLQKDFFTCADFNSTVTSPLDPDPSFFLPLLSPPLPCAR